MSMYGEDETLGRWDCETMRGRTSLRVPGHGRRLATGFMLYHTSYIVLLDNHGSPCASQLLASG